MIITDEQIKKLDLELENMFILSMYNKLLNNNTSYLKNLNIKEFINNKILLAKRYNIINNKNIEFFINLFIENEIELNNYMHNELLKEVEEDEKVLNFSFFLKTKRYNLINITNNLNLL